MYQSIVSCIDVQSTYFGVIPDGVDVETITVLVVDDNDAVGCKVGAVVGENVWNSK